MKKKNIFKTLVERVADAFLLKYIRCREENKKLKKRCRELNRKKVSINNRYVDLCKDTKVLVRMYEELEKEKNDMHDRLMEALEDKANVHSLSIDLREDIHNILAENYTLMEKNKKLNELYIELCRSIMEAERNK